MEQSVLSTQFNAETNVTGHITAPRCRFGTDTCNFEIEYPNDETANPEMYVTLPNTYHGYRVSQKYRMRSIIEAIQEINRRTATFNCNVSFETAKNTFDINMDDPYNQFACNDHEDGLPAVTNGILESDDIRTLYVTADQFDINAGENVFGLWDYVGLSDNETEINENIPIEYQLSCTMHRTTFANSTLNTETCIIDRENSPVDRIVVVDGAGNETIYYVTRFYKMFRSGRLNNKVNGAPDTIVKNVTLKDWSNKYIVDISNMFESSAQTSITFNNFNTSNVIYMTQMFINSKALPYIDISDFDTQSLLKSESMFRGCSSLKTIYMGNFTFKSIADGGQSPYMFSELPSGAIIYINPEGVAYIMSNWENLGFEVMPETIYDNIKEIGVVIK